MKLSSLIRKIRNAKTLAQERTIISKESAAIRAELGKSKNRARNVSKLIYIHTMGYPTHFGQMDCIMLMSSNVYSEKRVGYLALMILLDENQEVLPLIEHTLKKDLEDDDEFVKALALTTLSNIGSEDICRDLSANVEELITSSTPYLQKKVLLCGIRICYKCPELIENYMEKIGELLKNCKIRKNSPGITYRPSLRGSTPAAVTHSLILGIISFMCDLINFDRKYRVPLRKYLIKIITLIENLLNNDSLTNFNEEEYITDNVNDPLLLTKMVELLRLLGTGSVKASQEMTDILALVVSTVNKNKNVKQSSSSSILYESVLTILSIESEKGLKAMAKDIVCEFLKSGNKSNKKTINANRANLRYTALRVFKKLLMKDPEFVKKHGDIIVDCLKSSDLSIRRRSVELISLMVDRNNVKFLVGELINYLQTDNSFKDNISSSLSANFDENGLSEVKSEECEELTSNIYSLIENYSSSNQWKVNTLIRVILASGQNVSKTVANGFIKIILKSTEQHQRKSVTKLYVALKKLFSKPYLIENQNIIIQICVWCIGEFIGLLVGESSDGEDIEVNLDMKERKELIECLHSLFFMNEINGKSKLYILTSLFKISSNEKFKFARSVIMGFMKRLHQCEFYEAQQRSLIFYNILSQNDESILKTMCEKMPVIEDEEESDEEGEGEDEEGEDEDEETSEPQTKEIEEPIKEIINTPPKEETKTIDTNKVEEKKPEVKEVNILDFFNSPGPSTTTTSKTAYKLDELFNAPSTPLTPQFLKTAPLPKPMIPIDATTKKEDLKESVKKPSEFIIVYEDSDLKIEFELLPKSSSKDPITEIIVHFTNKTLTIFENLEFLVSVPPFLKRNVEKPSKSIINPVKKRDVYLNMKIKNNSKPRKKIILRFKLAYIRKDSGAKFSKVQPVKNIPMKY